MTSIYLHNIRSIKNKHHEVELIPTLYDHPSVIIITETWLAPHNENLYSIDGYKAEYNSREDTRRGGGLAVYVRQGVLYRVKNIIKIRDIEILSIYLQKDNITVTAVYKPLQVATADLKHVLQNALLNRKKPHIVVGDFNVNIMDNSNASIDYKYTITEHGYTLMNRIGEKYYTRTNPSGNNTILDHVITNVKHKIKKTKIVPTNISDHYNNNPDNRTSDANIQLP